MTIQTQSLDGKVAVVIGGTSGIGRALSLGLAEAGADVVATARHQPQVDETANEIEARGRRTLRHTADVCDRASLQKLLAATLDSFGKVDILINCAGKIKRTPTLLVSEAEWTDILDQPDRNPARLPGFWTSHDRTRLRQNHQHWIALVAGRAL